VTAFSRFPLLFPAGATWDYSNSGFAVLGLIIENVSGETYEQFLQNDVFAPLEMVESGIEANDKAPNFARGYQSGEEAVLPDMSIPFSAGALFSTVSDLHRWEESWKSGVLMSEETLGKFLARYVELNPPFWYGFGLYHTDVDALGDSYIFHRGTIDGFTAALFSGMNGPSVIVLSNNLTAPLHAEQVATNMLYILNGLAPPL